MLEVDLGGITLMVFMRSIFYCALGPTGDVLVPSCRPDLFLTRVTDCDASCHEGHSGLALRSGVRSHEGVTPDSHERFNCLVHLRDLVGSVRQK